MIPIGRYSGMDCGRNDYKVLIVDGIRSIPHRRAFIFKPCLLGKQKTSRNFCCNWPDGLLSFLGINFHLVGMVILYIAFLLTIYSGS